MFESLQDGLRSALKSLRGKGKLTDEGELVPLEVKVGDRVLFGKYSGQTVRVKGDELLVMREEDILGVVEGQP